MYNETKRTVAIVVAVAIVLSAILFFALCVRSVPTGYTGILTTFGKVEDVELSSGVHIKSPFQKIVRMDNRTQKAEVKTQTFSSDIQQVDVQMSVNYSIDQSTARNLYKTVGKEYYDKIVLPRILENTKAVFARYTAEALVSNRNTLSTEIHDRLSEDISEYGITISSFAVEDIDFTDAFTNAVEAKQVAQQNKLTAETQQAQKTMEQEQIAKRRIIDANAAAEEAKIQAEADLEVTKIQADAAEYAGLKEAAKNKAVAEWLSKDLLGYYYIQKWNGELPNFFMGDSADNILLTVPGQ